ncbi:TetR/AcrR family transcriptional regulator [Aeromicrobium stalagmiti]|uniref:TetR/AcrR family transcriptional regulator n=1 Tax=Aeromicrobium stalagmiti TaxID=2738988 RepID=UPI0015691567|nr:TetR/AcrR family transcriptional regulator [Aeromicrobium stalagmiti]NRQ50895.1 TetR/AcrR family transcriptional regulator [Aeromicrobium stalagmiti]
MARPRTVDDGAVLAGLTATFRSSGYGASSLSSLSEAAGLRSASLYHRFPGGKADMALAVLDDVARQFAHILEPLVTGSDPAADVTEMASRLSVFYSDGKLACVLETMTLDGAPDEVLSHARGLSQAWIDAMAGVATRAGAAPRDADRVAVDAFARIEGSLVASRVLADPSRFLSTLADLPDLLTLRETS